MHLLCQVRLTNCLQKLGLGHVSNTLLKTEYSSYVDLNFSNSGDPSFKRNSLISLSTRGPMGHILDTGIRCFRAMRDGISTAS